MSAELKEKLGKLRERLLDLSRRNPLIQFSHKPNPNLEGSVQDFDVCVWKQKAKGLSTDKCWDML